MQHNGRGERDEGQAQVPRVDRALPRAAAAVARRGGRLAADAHRPGDPAADGGAQADGLRLAPLRALRLPRIPLHEGTRCPTHFASSSTLVRVYGHSTVQCCTNTFRMVSKRKLERRTSI